MVKISIIPFISAVAVFVKLSESYRCVYAVITVDRTQAKVFKFNYLAVNYIRQMVVTSPSSSTLIIFAKSAVDIFVVGKVTVRSNSAVLRTKPKSSDRNHKGLVRPKS